MIENKVIFLFLAVPTISTLVYFALTTLLKNPEKEDNLTRVNLKNCVVKNGKFKL